MNESNAPNGPKKFKIRRGNVPSANSLANLRPAKKGDVRNPWGSKGKNGDALTLKRSYREYMNALSDADKMGVWHGLLEEGKKGNVAAIKMMIELGGEQVNDRLTEMAEIAANMPSLTIQIVDPKINDGYVEVLPDDHKDVSNIEYEDDHEDANEEDHI